MAALTADGGSLVAVGRDADGLAAWTSDDGADWRRHAVPDPTFIEELVDTFGPQIYQGTQMGSLTRLGDTLFSFGTFYGFNDFYRPVAWGSPEGTSWEFVESDSDFYGYGAVTDVETFHDGLVAARAIGLAGPNYSAWTWAPDTSWHETSIQSAQGASLLRLDAAASADQVVVVGQVAEHDSFTTRERITRRLDLVRCATVERVRPATGHGVGVRRGTDAGRWLDGDGHPSERRRRRLDHRGWIHVDGVRPRPRLLRR